MLVKAFKIDCINDYSRNSNRKNDFWGSEITFDFKRDCFDRYLKNRVFIEESVIMAKGVNPRFANNSSDIRTEDIILANSYAGVLSEYCWRVFINQCSEKNLVKETLLIDPENQIDLETIDKKLKIEVRSSFARNGIKFAICDPKYQFDILGPYHNDYKPNENEKNFYLRAIFHVQDYNEFLYNFDNKLSIFLLGGATKDMMNDNSKFIVKDLVPDGNQHNSKTSYRVIPYQFALDTFQIISKIRESENG